MGRRRAAGRHGGVLNRRIDPGASAPRRAPARSPAGGAGVRPLDPGRPRIGEVRELGGAAAPSSSSHAAAAAPVALLLRIRLAIGALRPLAFAGFGGR